MKTGQYVRVLAEFVTGQTTFQEFKQIVDERLVELRAVPQMTEEKKNLSEIELYLHEMEEGERTKFDVYAHVQSLLDRIISYSSGTNRVRAERVIRFGDLSNEPCRISTIVKPDNRKPTREEFLAPLSKK
jgi:hypothetical protein